MARKTKPIPIGVPAIPLEEFEAAFPGGFTARDEANALAAYAFRNGPLEDLHAGKSSPLLDDPSLSRITDDEMKRLMLNACEMLAKALEMRDNDPEQYRHFVQNYAWRFCRKWNR